MRIKDKMYHSSGLEYIVGSSYSNNSYSKVSYFSRNADDNYGFNVKNPTIFERQYPLKIQPSQYENQQLYSATYPMTHSFVPEIFLNPSRPKARFIDNNNEIRSISEETFELMMKEKLPSNISINILPFEEFRAVHSSFGAWGNGIMGFSINGDTKKIFVRENHLDALMLVIGHEIGHVLTETLPNQHDEEAKAFAFSIEWACAIKEHNISNLGLSIKDDFDFQPAKNGLHDVALSFVDFMIRRGRKAVELHKDLVKRYVSIFDRIY